MLQKFAYFWEYSIQALLGPVLNGEKQKSKIFFLQYTNHANVLPELTNIRKRNSVNNCVENFSSTSIGENSYETNILFV